ncbi:hypothetical protein [Geobacter sp. AOG2]|uniref:hypothetical protein n=1 Tax=Geobacter sp. AOG2 TaxID=1566347 RepID=UPI001CC5D1DD|nr:hypothetical protein [Geobacter sp. AOG2]GFE61693.1 hypothetical protein AOG2_22800 [Geobacter sp. AOG2]
MITKLSRTVLFVAALAALSGCASASNVATVAFQDSPKPEDLICSVDNVTVKVSAGNGLALENALLARMESGVREALYRRKKFSPCAIYVPRNFVLDMKITRLTADGKLEALLSPKIDTVLFDGDFVLSQAAPQDTTLAKFSMKDSFAWGCPIKDSHFLWGLFASTTGQGGACGSATALDIIEDTIAEELAKVVVVTPIPTPAIAADTVKTDKQGDEKADAKPDKEKPAGFK